MVYEGVVRNGVVVLPADSNLPDGTKVEVRHEPGQPRSFRDFAAFGMWADRDDMQDSAAASLRLREELMRRGN